MEMPEDHYAFRVHTKIFKSIVVAIRHVHNFRANGHDGDSSNAKLYCQICKKSSPIKSNKAISEELERIAGYLLPPVEPGYPVEGCENSALGVFSTPEASVCKARRKTSRRLMCKACRLVFSVKGKAFAGQKKPMKTRPCLRKSCQRSRSGVSRA